MKKVLYILAWPFLLIGVNIWVWLYWLWYRLFAERTAHDIHEGDVATVITPFRTVVATDWRGPFSDGHRCDLPEGLELRAREEARAGSRCCNFVPVDREGFETTFIPAEITSSPKYAGSSILLTARQIRRHLELTQ